MEGATYIFAANYVRNGAHGVQMTNAYFREFVYRALLAAEDFSDGDMSRFTVVDEGIWEAPSQWLERRNRLFQLSNIYGPAPTAVDHRRGTFAFWNPPQALSWSNYACSVTVNDSDNDGMGLLFRYRNPSNYYKIDLDAQRGFRKLFKMADGVETTLAVENAGYVPGQDHLLRVRVTNDQIIVRLNSMTLFNGPVLDSSLPVGTVALYSWGSQGVSFSNLVVTPPFSLPLVSITNPPAGVRFGQFSVIPIGVAASDPDGTVVQVEVFDGPNSLARLFQPPYCLDWTNPAPGDHLIVAKVTDQSGLVGSAMLSITVTNPSVAPPSSWIREPQSQWVPAGNGVLFEALAAGGEPLSYQWYRNGQLIPSATNRFFFINQANPDNAANYGVIATNDGGGIVSRVALLSVAEIVDPPGGASNGVPRLRLIALNEGRVPVLSLEDPSALAAVQVSSTSLWSWLPLLAPGNRGSPFFFLDPAGATSPARFYRALAPP